MVGWGESDLIGARPPFLYWPPEEIDTITQALGKVIEGESSLSGIELRFARRDGDRIEVLLQVTPLKDSFSNVTGWVSSVSDITGRKRAEVRLASEPALTRILATPHSPQQPPPLIYHFLLTTSPL